MTTETVLYNALRCNVIARETDKKGREFLKIDLPGRGVVRIRASMISPEPKYMSPEEALREPVNYRDFYNNRARMSARW